VSVLAKILDDFRFYRTIKPGHSFIAVALDRFFWINADYRFRHWACYVRLPLLGRLLRLLGAFSNLLVTALTGVDIHPGAVIGRRFHVHTSFGIVIADGVVIGDDCTINAGVGLINKANGRGEGVPRIGNRVSLSSGCKVMGGITIGDFAVVGANSVVIRDVPSYHMALGVPAMNMPLAEKLAPQPRPEAEIFAAAD
jgi:serine O-acetyltransferase